MPILDMPLAELRTYSGLNPRPDDFDEFWDSGLDEMRELSTAHEMEPSEFQVPYARCDHLYFRGVGGAKVHAKLLRPSGGNEPGPAVVMFHGYSGDSGEWNDKLAYVAMGFTVAALDCRGQAGLSQDVGGVRGTTHHGHIIRGLDDSPRNLLYRSIFLDTAQLARIVMSLDSVDENRVAATGGSQGGGLTLACAALEPKIARAAPTFPFLTDYRRVWEMDLAKRAYQELSTFFRHHDPLHEREEETFTRLGYIDVQHLAPRIRASVLMGLGLMDDVCPPSSQFAAFNKITSKKDMLIYPDFGHERLPGHGDKIFQFLADL
jgi:cephalosporin-C deacetylase